METSNKIKSVRPASIKAIDSFFREMGHPMKITCTIEDDGTPEFKKIWNLAHKRFDDSDISKLKGKLIESDFSKVLNEGDFIVDQHNCLSLIIHKNEDGTFYLRKKLLKGGYIFVRQNINNNITVYR